MRLKGAVLLLFLGVVFPLLLNGQTFTNSAIALACATAGVALALPAARDPRAAPATRRVGRVCAALGVFLAALVAAQLPTAYRLQARFNRKVAELRRAHGEKAHVPPAVR